MRRLIGLLIAAVLSGPLKGHCEVSLSVEPRSGTTSRTFMFGVTVRNETASKAPEIGQNDDFSVQYVGPQQSVKIINGAVSQETSFFYRLKPKHQGALKTPPVTVELPGGDVTPEPLEVPVGDSGEAGEEADAAEVLLEQTVTPQTVFRGQQVLNTTSILTSLELRDIHLDSPTVSDFWEESIRPDERDEEVRGGQSYSVVRMRRAVFPLKSGALTLPSKTITAVAVRSKVGSLLDDMDPFGSHFMSNLFSMQPDTIEQSSAPVKLTVKDLPPLPADAELWGGSDPLIGDTSLSMKASSKMVNPGEAKELVFTVQSEGNLNMLSAVPIAENKRWKIYPESAKTSSAYRNGKVVFTKTFPVSIVPTTGGDFDLPPLSLTYFDPQSEIYKIARTDPIRVLVSGTPDPSVIAPKTSKPRAKIDSEVPPEEDADAGRPFGSYLVIAAGLLLLAAGLASLLRRPRVPEEGEITVRTPAKAPAPVSKDEIPGEPLLYKVFTDAIQKRYASPRAGSVRAALQDALLDSPTRFEIESLLDELEERLYGATNGARREDDFAQLKDRVFDLMSRW